MTQEGLVTAERTLGNGIFEILKQIHHSCGISTLAMTVAQSMAIDFLRKIVESTNGNMLKSSSIQQAMKDIMDDQLVHAIEEMRLKFATSIHVSALMDSYIDVTVENSVHLNEQIRNSNISTTLPINAVYEHVVRVNPSFSISLSASLYLTSVLEGVMGIIVGSAGQNALDSGVQRITPRNIQLAIQGNEPLQRFMVALIAGGGPLPSIGGTMLPTISTMPN